MDGDPSQLPPIPEDPADVPIAPAPVLLRRAIRTLAGQLGVLLLSFGFAVAIARALTPADRGNFALLQGLNGFTAVAANFAISGAMIYHIGKRLLSVPKAASAAFTAAIISSGVGVLVFVPIGLAIRPHLLPTIPISVIIVAVVLAVCILLREYLGGVFIAVGRPLRSVSATAVQPAAALLVLFLLLLLNRATFSGVVFAWAIGLVLSGLTAILLTVGLAGRWKRFQYPEFISVARFGVRAYPALLARFLNLRLDQFIVRALSSAAVLGQYAVAVNVGELLLRIPTQMLWAFSGAISAHDRESSASLVAQFCRWTLLLIVVTSLLVGIATPFLVPMVFGPAYRPAVPAILFLLPGMVLYAPASIIVEFFIVQRGRPGYAAFIAGTSILANGLLNVPLVPTLGAVGASVASTLSYGVMFISAALLFKRDSGRPLGSLVPTSREDFLSLARAFRRAVGRTRE